MWPIRVLVVSIALCSPAYAEGAPPGTQGAGQAVSGRYARDRQYNPSHPRPPAAPGSKGHFFDPKACSGLGRCTLHLSQKPASEAGAPP